MLQVSAACRAAPHHAVAALGANWRDNRKQVSWSHNTLVPVSKYFLQCLYIFLSGLGRKAAKEGGLGSCCHWWWACCCCHCSGSFYLDNVVKQVTCSSPDMGAVFDECLTMLFSNSVFGECNFSLKKDFCRTLLLDSFHKGEACLNYCTTSPNIIKTSLTCLFIPPSLQKTWHDDLLLQAPRLHAIFKGTGANGAGQATHLVFDRGKSLECLCDIAWYELKCWCPSAELDTSKDEGRPSFDERQKLSLGKFSASAIRLLSAEGNSQYHTFEKTLPSSSLWSWSGHLEKFIWLIQKSFAEKYGVLNSILVLRPYQCHCHLNRL